MRKLDRSVALVAALCAVCVVGLFGAGSAGATVAPVQMTFMCAYSQGAGPVYFPVSGQCAPYTTRLSVTDFAHPQSVCYLTSNGAIWWTAPSACAIAPRTAEALLWLPQVSSDLFFCASSRDGTLYYQPNGIPAAGCPSGQFAVVVKADQAPLAVSQAVSLLEDSSKLVTLTGSDQDPGQTITFKITALPQHGHLYRGNSTAAADEITTVPATVPSAGTSANVTYKPNADYFGPDSFVFKTNDSFLDSAPATVTLDVQPVNDAPSFSHTFDGLGLIEDYGLFTAVWAVQISKGPANESGQTLTFHVSNNNNALFAVQPQVNAATGVLTFTTAADAYGGATVSVYLKDDGGTANGGVDTSATQTFTITVFPVNDAPSFTLPASPDQTVAVNAGAQTVPGFASNISPGPANEAGQTVAFHVSTSNNALFSVLPTINASTGDLTYTPAAGQTGTATVSVYLQDNGGTVGSGVDTSATKTFTITVAPIVIGQTRSPNGICGGDFLFVQTGVSAGASYTVPAGNWTLTEWSTQAFPRAGR